MCRGARREKGERERENDDEGKADEENEWYEYHHCMFEFNNSSTKLVTFT